MTERERIARIIVEASNHWIPGDLALKAADALAATPAVGGERDGNFTERAIKLITEAAGHRDDWGKYEYAIIDLAREADAAQPASPLRGREPETLHGQINAVYGSLDAEDCAWIDREWMKLRGIVAAPPEQPAALPLAVRLRDEAGPPLPQMVAQRRAQLSQEQPAADPATDAIFDLCVMIVEEECYLDDPVANGPIFKTGLAIRDRIRCAQRNPDPVPNKQPLDGETGA